MHLLRLFLVYIHLIGFALLLGGGVMRYLAGRIQISSTMLWGSVIQIVSGLALAALVRGENDEPTAKLATKLIIAVLIFIMAFVPRHRERVNRGHFLAIIGLTLADAAVAVFWY